MPERLKPFQSRLLKIAHSGRYRRLAWSMPRGGGKSYLAARFIYDLICPASPRHMPGAELVTVAASQKQALVLWRYLRGWLDDGKDWRFSAATNNIHVLNKRHGTLVTVHSSNAKTMFGLQGVPWVVADEPGSWEVAGGELMRDAIETSMGKLGSDLRVLYIGTRAPALAGWWHDMLDAGTTGGTFVHDVQGDIARWDDWREIKRCNPLLCSHAEGREVLREELNAARADSRLKAQFLSYRLNVPAADESTVLLTVQDYQLACARPVAAASGRPVLGIDLGANRAWSAAVALWENGRCEAIALAPGIPSIPDQEKRDRVPRGTYAALVESGRLLVATGLRVPPAAMLVKAVEARWGPPAVAVCDRFRIDDLRDAGSRWQINERVCRYSEAAADIRALRASALDGPLSIAPDSRLLIGASLSAAMVRDEGGGNTRLLKRGANNQARDDVAAALVLASGEAERQRRIVRPKIKFLGAV